MEVTTYHRSGTYGIYVGVPNRRVHFESFRERGLTSVEVEIAGEDGQYCVHRFGLKEVFWTTCPEITDPNEADEAVIEEWLRRHFDLPWEQGQPPHHQLVPVDGDRFRLVTPIA